MRIKAGPRKREALRWIRKAQQKIFDPGNAVDEGKADAKYFWKKARHMARRHQFGQAVKAFEKALRLYRKSEKKIPEDMFSDMAKALARTGRFAEAQKVAEQAPERDRHRIVRSIGYIQVKEDPKGAADLAEQHLGSDANNPLSFGFDMAILAKSRGLLEKVVKRGFKHIEQQENAHERTEAARRDFVMQLQDAVQRRHQKGERLSVKMKAAVTGAMDRVVRAFPEVGPTAADLYADMGEVDKALKIAKVGTGASFTEASGLVAALVKQGRYEEALKFTPTGLGIVARGYAKDGRYKMALEVAERIPLNTHRTDNRGYRRNRALYGVAKIQAKAKKIEQAIATLERMVSTKDWNDAVKRRKRTQAEIQLKYATRLVHILTNEDGQNLPGAGKLLAYAKENLRKFPEAGRDNAVRSIRNASRALENASPHQTGSLEDLQKLADVAKGTERIGLLTKIAARYWDANDKKAYRDAIVMAKETVRSASLKPKDKISAWVSIAVAEHLSRSEQEDKKDWKAALDRAWQAAEQAIAQGEEDSVMVRVYAYMPFLMAYHQMNRWDELPEAFAQIESPLNRALAFYTVGAMLQREGEKLFDLLDQAP